MCPRPIEGRSSRRCVGHGHPPSKLQESRCMLCLASSCASCEICMNSLSRSSFFLLALADAADMPILVMEPMRRSHRLHNKLMHALHGNPSPPSPCCGLFGGKAQTCGVCEGNRCSSCRRPYAASAGMVICSCPNTGRALRQRGGGTAGQVGSRDVGDSALIAPRT